MRGILECWVKQSSRIELFKRNQCNRFALHCKFHLYTGDMIFNDAAYNHLQVIIIYNKNNIYILNMSMLNVKDFIQNN